jgi:predicted metal-dependent hydrolase
MSSKQISLPRVGLVTLYKRHGNRSLRLSISSQGEVRVSQPYWLPYSAGEQFATSRIEWILGNRPAPRQLLQSGKAIGKAHHLYFEAMDCAAHISTRIKDNQIHITFPFSLNEMSAEVQKAAHKAGLRALRKEAEALLPGRLRELAARSGFTYRSVQIRHLKSRWGSCSSAKEITLNLFLMQLPWHLIDYVLLHELVHTKVMRHGTPFWQEIEHHEPRAKQLRKELHTYQPMLRSV